MIDAVAWKGVAARFPFDIKEGMELIATGKVTSYPGQSKYQLIIDHVELAGEGALLKLLEDRRKALMAEGLFHPERKKPLPMLPRSIGIISSPNGAVIRDIWHRVRDRFPLPVRLWPVLVQGQGAAAQVTRAIHGFSNLPADQRPDVLIVARGGGSLEDLWAFNEEEVVRAAAACPIPLISAIGHETDTTLLDYVADRRAPTPTAAAEFAVPVRADLAYTVADAGQRLARATQGRLQGAQQGLADVGRSLLDPQSLLDRAAQDLDVTSERFTRGAHTLIDQAKSRLEQVAARLADPMRTLRAKQDALISLDPHKRLRSALAQLVDRHSQNVEGLWARVNAREIARKALRAQGWVTVQNSDGKTLTSATQIIPNQAYVLDFHDGPAHVVGEGPVPKRSKPSKPAKPKPATPSQQDALF